MNKIREQMQALGAKIREQSTRLQALLEDGKSTVSEIQRARSELEESNARMAALRSLEEAQRPVSSRLEESQEEETNRPLEKILSSREYHRAFRQAARLGLHPGKPCPDEKLNILYQAMTIAGGDPAGEDGGFLVPQDVNTQIIEQMRALPGLSNLFNIEYVSHIKGSRPVDTAPTTGLTSLGGELPADGIPADDQPVFAQVAYNIGSYGLYIPMSRELVENEDADLFGYLARWMAKKQTITENNMLIAKLKTLTAANLVPAQGKPIVNQLKSVFNLALDPAISQVAHVICNQDAYDYLDQEVDGNGRALLQPDPTKALEYRLIGRPAHMVSNAHLATRKVTTEGATKGVYYPIFAGAFQQFATLFRRKYLEVNFTDIGGDAWRKNGYEVRAITGLDAQIVDGGAAVWREIFIADAAENGGGGAGGGEAGGGEGGGGEAGGGEGGGGEAGGGGET